LKGAYHQAHCWQYDIRLKNLESDLNLAGLDAESAKYLRVSDFEFQFVSKDDRTKCNEIISFIERHEWLGKMPTRPTHRFIATYKGRLAGVVVMATPNSFSNLLGPEHRHAEKLISRGACISWSPKNLASALIMYAVRWMVKHTEFRFFTAYSDTEARELGTIYQACNFTYLGQNSGAREEYFDPSNGKGWFSDRQFRKTSQIKKYANALGIGWRPEWSSPDKILWDKIPSEVSKLIRAHAERHKSSCERRELHPKHKYLYILGRTKKETKTLKEIFQKRNPDLCGLAYPKIRGPQSNTAANVTDTADQALTKDSQNYRPAERDYLTVKEVADMLRVSDWTIYNIIKTDRSFPYLNIDLKKKLVIENAKLSDWLSKRTKRLLQIESNIPTGEALLRVKGVTND
jgi:predicted DNA-binding transcriptional regulator AlpA